MMRDALMQAFIALLVLTQIKSSLLYFVSASWVGHRESSTWLLSLFYIYCFLYFYRSWNFFL